MKAFTTNEIYYTDDYESDNIIGILPVYRNEKDIPAGIAHIEIEIEDD